MKKFKLIPLLILLSVVLFGFNTIESDASINPFSALFKIERSKDNNQIFYDVNITNTGELDNKNPIKIYWRRNTEGGIIKPLTWIQQKYAYGLDFLKVDQDHPHRVSQQDHFARQK